MEQRLTFDEHLNNAKMMLEQGHANDFIESQLNKGGADSITMSEVLMQIKHLRNAKRTQTGGKLILSGVALMGLGFIVSFFLLDSGTLLAFALYGLTSIGVILLVAGLVMIFH